MSKKGTKIKRYGSIYGRNSGSLTILLVMVAGLAIFGLAGWFLYTPIHDFIMGLGEQDPQQSPYPASSQTGEQPQPGSDAQRPGASPAAPGQMKGIYLPADMLLDGAAFAASLDSAAAAGFNTVVTDAKDASGTVLYSSGNDVAKSSGVAAADVYDAAATAAAIKEKGLSPAVRLHAFRDALAPIARRDMAVHYYDTEVYWFDNAPESGGKPWLNPYSAEARQYILSLIGELAEAGFETVLLDSVQFPSGVGLDKAGFGPEAQNTARAELLARFISDAKAAAGAAGCELILCGGADWLAPGAGANYDWLYGGDPADLFTDSVMLTLSTDSSTWPGRLAQAGGAAASRLLALIPAYAADGTLTESGVLAEAVTEAGASGYLLFNPQGNYKFG